MNLIKFEDVEVNHVQKNMDSILKWILAIEFPRIKILLYFNRQNLGKRENLERVRALKNI